MSAICGRFVNILINHFWIPAGSKELLAITSASRFSCLVCYLFLVQVQKKTRMYNDSKKNFFKKSFFFVFRNF